MKFQLRGFSLVEILIAIIILSIAVIALYTQLISVQSNQHKVLLLSYGREIALNLLLETKIQDVPYGSASEIKEFGGIDFQTYREVTIIDEFYESVEIRILTAANELVYTMKMVQLR